MVWWLKNKIKKRGGAMDSDLRIIDKKNPLETLRRCGGFYECPKNSSGKRLGPLVGYAGKYTDGIEKQYVYVGDIYVNFSMADELPLVLDFFAQQMEKKLTEVLPKIGVFCGAPLGGYSFSQALGCRFYNWRVIKVEKKVTALATANMREQSEVVFNRHRINPGDKVAVVEDVCNNFSTTDQLINLIQKSGGETVAIVCLLNRSLTVDDTYTTSSGIELPVISLVRLPIKEYRQDDPLVADDIRTGNVVWKPKNEWPCLMEAMNTKPCAIG
jgi:orotate phosphoribosyltransferase